MSDMVKHDEALPTLSQDVIASLVLNGDLSKLTPGQKVQYYRAMCNRLGLDPATQPFKLLKFEGKEVLYCDRSGVQQLNKLHKISHEVKRDEVVSDVYKVFARAIGEDGRFTESCGAVAVSGLSGKALANAMMSAETKAKRRATLDLVGLGMDDGPVDALVPANVDQGTGEIRETVALPDTVCPMGQHKGKKISEIPHDALAKQLAWCKNERKFPDYARALEAYLEGAMAPGDGQAAAEDHP